MYTKPNPNINLNEPLNLYSTIYIALLIIDTLYYINCNLDVTIDIG